MLQSYLHFRASFQQENQRRINHPVPTPTFPIPLHRRSPRRSETATVVNGPGLLQFKSKGATYLKSENGVMRRASCLRHFSFFPMNMAMYWGSTSFQTRPRCVEWPLIAMSVPKHHFSSWLSHLPQNYANQLRASSFCGWNRKKLYPPTVIKYMPEENPSKSHIWYPSHIKIAFRCSFPQQNSISRHRCWSILVFQSTKFIFAWQPHLCSLMARVIPVISQ